VNAGSSALHLLYGGTFDPVHAGHLAVAHAALDATGASRLGLLPSADPPHRPPPGASALDRAAMLVLATRGEARIGVDRRELRREGRSYTVDSLRGWRVEHGHARPLAFVLGADAFLGLPSWHDWTALFELAHLIVAVRPGFDLHAGPQALEAAVDGRWAASAGALGQAPSGSVFRLQMPPRPESATALRGSLAAGDSAPAGLAPEVAAYARRRGLYRPASA